MFAADNSGCYRRSGDCFQPTDRVVPEEQQGASPGTVGKSPQAAATDHAVHWRKSHDPDGWTPRTTGRDSAVRGYRSRRLVEQSLQNHRLISAD